MESLNEAQPLIQQIEKGTTCDQAQPCTFVFDQIRKISDVDQLLKSGKEAISSGQHHAFHVAMVDFMKRLDSDSLIANCKDVKKAKASVITLGQLSQIFFETCVKVSGAEIIFPDRAYVLLKLLFLQKNLATL